MAYLVIAISLLNYCHHLGGPTGLSSLPLFFLSSPNNNPVLLVAISVLHSELHPSYPQLLKKRLLSLGSKD